MGGCLGGCVCVCVCACVHVIARIDDAWMAW